MLYCRSSWCHDSRGSSLGRRSSAATTPVTAVSASTSNLLWPQLQQNACTLKIFFKPYLTSSQQLSHFFLLPQGTRLLKRHMAYVDKSASSTVREVSRVHADQSRGSHHVNGRPHVAHVLLGKFSFLTVLPFSFFMGTANATVRAVARAHLPEMPTTPTRVSPRHD